MAVRGYGGNGLLERVYNGPMMIDLRDGIDEQFRERKVESNS